jgi:hypothetical protein
MGFINEIPYKEKTDEMKMSFTLGFKYTTCISLIYPKNID